MESVIVKRAIGIFSIILVIIIASVACNVLTGDEESPEISNPDTVFMTFGNVEITNEMLFNRIKARDGYVHLFNHIDAKLLADYMEAISEDEINDYILELTYGTSDSEEIDRLTEGEKEEFEQDFNDVVMLEGYDPEDPDSVDAFARLYLSQLNYTQAQYRDGEEGDPFSISEDDLERFYNDYKQGDAVAIPLRFFDSQEKDAVFNHFNLIDNYEGGFALYTGEKAIEDVSTDEYDDDNTQILTEDEVLQYFIRIYNYLNQHTDDINAQLNKDGLINLDYEAFAFNQMELMELSEERQEEVYVDVATLLFENLKHNETPYHFRTQNINDEDFFFYLVDVEDVPEFEELSNEDKEDLKDEYVDLLITDERIEQVMRNLHDENNLKIHDEKLALRYEMQSNELIFESNDDKTLIASLDDFTVTTDEFFEAAVNRIGTQYATDLAKVEYLIDSKYFDDAYGSNRDVFKNSSELMRRHRNDLREEKQNFSNGLYAQFGLDPQTFSWNEFLFLFGQAQPIRQQILQMVGVPDPLARYNFSEQSAFVGEEDLLRQMVERTIRYDYMSLEIDYDYYHQLVEKNYNEHFSLIAEHFLVYTDMENDFVPDDFDDYYDSLSEIERDELNTLRANLYDKINNRVDDGESLDEIAREYMRSLRGEDEEDEDYSEWAVYRNAGLRVTHQALNEGESLNARNTRNYAENFVTALKAIYDDFDGDEDEEYAVNASLTRTQFGFHFIKAEQGSAFKIPSARLEDGDDRYDERIENTSDMPNAQQMEMYTKTVIDQYTGSDVDIDFPQEVIESLALFYEPVFNVLLSEYYFTILMADMMLDEDVEFASNQDFHRSKLNGLSDFYNRRLFPQLQE